MILKLLQKLSNRMQTSFAIKLPNAKEVQIGEHYGSPLFRVIVKDQEGLQALKLGDELKISEAYVFGHIDLEGKVDMLKLLELEKLLSNNALLSVWKKIVGFFSNQVALNRKSIAKHYEFDDEFYLMFLDKTRSYSQAVFNHEQEPLEQASLRKLEFAMNSCHLRPGMKVLDLGGGWGNALEFLGTKGIHVDALTISNKSAQFLLRLIEDKKLTNCRVLKKDFLVHEVASNEKYDAIFSLGTLEHLPNYKKVLEKCQALLRDSGFAYFDASAKKPNRDTDSNFIVRHIFPGNHRLLDIYSFLNEVEKSAFDLISLHNDTHNYYLTIKHWAQNLDAHHKEIVSRWGETLYRKFQIYLWGSCYGMYTNELQAYRIVLRNNSA